VKVSRAGFLKIFGAAALARCVPTSALISFLKGSGVPESAAPDAPSSGGRFLLQDASAHHFSPHVNTVFTVRSRAEGPVPLVLARVSEGPRTPGIEQFSLIFRGRSDAAVGEGTQMLHHPVLGDLDLFIAPVGRSSARAAMYEACFSRHVIGAAREGATAVSTPHTEEQTCRMFS
jgi:hypothetical protein